MLILNTSERNFEQGVKNRFHQAPAGGRHGGAGRRGRPAAPDAGEGHSLPALTPPQCGRPGRSPPGLHGGGRGQGGVRYSPPSQEPEDQPGRTGPGVHAAVSPACAGGASRSGGRRARGALRRPGAGPGGAAPHPAGAGPPGGATEGGCGTVLGHGRAGPDLQCPIRRGRRRSLLGREAEHRHTRPPPPLYPGDVVILRRSGGYFDRCQTPCGHGLSPHRPGKPAPPSAGTGNGHPV